MFLYIYKLNKMLDGLCSNVKSIMTAIAVIKKNLNWHCDTTTNPNGLDLFTEMCKLDHFIFLKKKIVNWRVLHGKLHSSCIPGQWRYNRYDVPLRFKYLSELSAINFSTRPRGQFFHAAVTPIQLAPLKFDHFSNSMI